MNNFNSFLEQAQNTLMCDSECQKKKQIEKYEQEYLNSLTNLKTAQYKVNTSEKQYITLTQGNKGFSLYEENKLKTQGQQIVKIFMDNFNNDVQTVKNKVVTHSGLLSNYNNVYELYLNYLRENKELNKNVITKVSDIATNERKTYYEEQQIDLLDYIYKYILLIIYIIVVIAYFISMFFYSSFTWIMKISILIFLIGLPFVSTWILSAIILGFYKIYDILPKNIYKNL
jgi:hypothetical protein